MGGSGGILLTFAEKSIQPVYKETNETAPINTGGQSCFAGFPGMMKKMASVQRIGQDIVGNNTNNE